MPLARRSRLVVAGLVLTVCLVAAPAWPSSARPAPARVHAAATCADYPNQAAAQRAAETRDPDGDGLYCESLPCPCSSAAGGGGGTPPSPTPSPGPSCTRPRGVQSISFSATKYPNIRAHFRAALRRGWPRTLVLNRPGADERRDRLLRDIPTRSGFDRDEYPSAVVAARASSEGRAPAGGGRT